MDQFLFQNESESKRAMSLEAICEGMEEMDYANILTPDEMTVRKSQLTTLVIQEVKLNERKEKFMTELKAELKPIQTEKNQVIQELKAGSVQETGVCFKIIDDNTRMVGFYNSRGQLVHARPMTQEDGQRTLKLAVNN